MRAEGEHDLNGVPTLFPEPRLKLDEGRMVLLFKVVFIREKWEKPVDIFSSLVELIVFSGVWMIGSSARHALTLISYLMRVNQILKNSYCIFFKTD